MTTTKLLITEMTASQSQKHVTFNEALFTLDNLVQLSVIDKDLSAPPVGPTVGDTYIVGGGASGSWLGKENNVASYDGDGWIFFPPNDGWFCWVDDENELYFYDGGWSTLGAVVGAAYLPLVGGTMTGDLALEEASPSIRFGDTDINGDTLLQTSGVNFQISVDYNNVDAGSTFQVLIDGNTELEVNEHGLGIGGASADATNGFSFFGTNVLFNSSASIAQVFNKALATDDASFTFQQGFTTYAQMGLLGDNDWVLKVGTGANIAIAVDNTTGAVDLVQHPKFSAYVNFDAYIAANTWTKVPCNNARHNDQGAFNGTTNLFTAPHDGYYSFGAGFTFKENATVPTEIRVGLSINGAAPTEDRSLTFADTFNMTGTLKTSVNIGALLKLSASDTVEMQVYMATNDGYVEANSNHFWGHQVP
ncbi:ribonuclease III [Roseobacter phage RDJL3]|nr:ribonuclease III [Roseobacter phage RDJL3]